MKKKAAPAFWDSSALVLLICQQPLSARARSAQRTHPLLHVWWSTRIECCSAVRRLAREGWLSAQEESQAMSIIGKLSRQWNEILPEEEIRNHAERLLARHPLRAADALQLAAALAWCKGYAAGRQFICADRNLSEAAAGEGFTVNFLN